MSHLFCFGFGYTAQNLAAISQTKFQHISGTSRTSFKHDIADVMLYDDLLVIPQDVTHILISIPPNENGDPVFQQFIGQISKLSKLKWIGYFSTTGVYGNTDGEWVDENSPRQPYSALAVSRIKAEDQWLTAFKEQNIPSHIFRLSGIYGPNRNNIEQARSGTLQLINKPNQVFSRVHVYDIATLLMRSINAPSAGQIYNVSDDYPCNPLEVSEFCYKLAGKIPPRPIAFEDANLSEMAKSFYSQSRRVSNAKAKTHLKWKPKFASYKEGLLDCLSISTEIAQ